MKKALLPLFILLLAGFVSAAQTSVEIIPMAGYTFPDEVNFYDVYGRIDGGLSYGGSIQFNVTRGFGIEFMYNRMDAIASMYKYGSSNQPPISQQNAGINYFMAGPVQSINFPGSPVHLFLGGMLGAAAFTPSPVDYSSNVKFAWGVQAGTNIYVTPRLGIRLKAQLLSPVDGTSGGYYFGNFGGGANVYTYSSIYQFGFSAGLIMGIGNILPQPKPRVMIRHHAPPTHYYYPGNPNYYHN